MGNGRASNIPVASILDLTSYSSVTLLDDKEMKRNEKRGKKEDGRRKKEKGNIRFYVESTWRSILAYSIDDHIIWQVETYNNLQTVYMSEMQGRIL